MSGDLRPERFARRRRIAVVGGGAAGITAAHVLQHAHDVTLFEAAPRLGGHAHTVEVEKGVSVDTAFLIYNDRHYPNFVALLDQLGVRDQTEPAEMSAAFIDHDKRLHYALLRGLGGLFADRKNAIRPAFYRLFAEVALFRRRASRDLRRDAIDDGVTLGRYLAPYSPLLRDNFVVPLASAIWSLEGDHVLAYPARAILRFFHNHQLLEGRSGDAWRTFRGGSETYVRAFQAKFRGALCLGAPISKVLRQEDSSEGGVIIHAGSEARSFDEVVFATHADTALRLLGDPSSRERELLGPWRYQDNRITLHTDESWVHVDPRLHASWNIVMRGGVSRVTYFLNRVQSLATDRRYFLTVGEAPIRASSVIERFDYRHPVFDVSSVATQGALKTQFARRFTHFCGSYSGYGFHEDAVSAALHVANRFGLSLDSSRAASGR